MSFILHHSPMSPFARKCRILIRAKNLDVKEVLAINLDGQGYTSEINPLGKIPILERPGAGPLYDSPVICEFLDKVNAPWLREDGEARWEQLRLHRLGDGLAEAVYNYRYEVVRDENLHWAQMIARHENAISNVINHLEGECKSFSAEWNFANIAIVCALDYCDFRAGHMTWRSHAPQLSAWHAGFAAQKAWAETNAYS